MAQEEHSQKCSNSSSGGVNSGGVGASISKSCKRSKQKKVPQRGLGVAQLERIRLEEQNKKDAALQAATVFPPNPVIQPSRNSPSSLTIQAPNLRPNMFLSSNHLPPPSPSTLPSPNSVFIPAPPIRDFDGSAFSKTLNLDGDQMGWSAISGQGQGKWPKAWNSEYNLQGDNHKLDNIEFKFPPNMHFVYESNIPLWPLPTVMQRSQQLQLHCSSSMVNVSSRTSSSSVINFPMEPPSNQSYFVNNYTPLRLEDEKMVGMKRPYPFSLENPPAPSFYCKLPHCLPSVSRLNEFASCCHGETDNIETMREGLPSSSGIPITDPNPKVAIKENGDFLSLAPPSTHLYFKHGHPSSIGPGNQEFSEMEALPHQFSIEDSVQRPSSVGSNKRAMFSFFPSENAQIDQATTTIESSRNGEAGENVDLNLKL